MLGSSTSAPGEKPLPGELELGVGVLPVKGSGQLDPAPTLGEVLGVDLPDLADVGQEGSLEGGRQHGDTILAALAVSDKDQAFLEVDILDAKLKAFVQPQAGAIQKTCCDEMGAPKVGKKELDLGLAHHDRKTKRLLGADDRTKILRRILKDMTVQEKDGGQSLVLGGSADLPPRGQIAEETVDFNVMAATLIGARIGLEIRRAPVSIGLDSAHAVVPRRQLFAKAVQKPEMIGGLLCRAFCRGITLDGKKQLLRADDNPLPGTRY